MQTTYPPLKRNSGSGDSPMLYRKRLVTQLTDALESCGAIFIEGQASQGKTTLVNQYANNTDKKVAIIPLQEEDGDTAVFLKKIICNAHCQNSTCWPQDETALPDLQLVINQLAGTTLILEQVDAVASHEPLYPLLGKILDTAPDSLHLIITSRSSIIDKIPFNRIYYPVITNSALAFNRDESDFYLIRCRNIPLSEEIQQQLFEATEGWPGGLNILANALNKLTMDTLHPLPRPAAPAIAMNKELFRLFETEVMSGCQPKHRHQLTLSSLFESLDSHLLESLFGKQFVMELLAMSRQNQFVESYYTPETNSWLFRFHNLFKSFLEAQLPVCSTPDMRKSLLTRAAAYAASAQDHEQALHYYSLADRYDKCVEIIKNKGINAYKQGKLQYLKNLLSMLPRQVISESPWLRMLDELTIPFNTSVSTYKNIANAFMFTDDDRGALLSLALFLLSCNTNGVNSSAIPHVLFQADLLIRNDEEKGLLYEKSFLLLAAGLWHLFRGQEIHKSALCLHKAWALAHKDNDIPLQITSLGYSVLSSAYLGKFQQAEKMYGRMKQLLDSNTEIEGAVPFKALIHTTHCMYLALWGKNEESRHISEKATEATREMGNAFLKLIAQLCVIMVHKYAGEFATAREAAQEAISYSKTQGQNCQMGAILFHYGSVEYFAGNDECALPILQEAYSMSKCWDTCSALYEHMTRITMSLIHMHTSPPTDEDIRYLEEATKIFDPDSDALLRINIGLVLGLAFCSSGKDSEGARHIKDSLQLAQANDLKNFFLINESDTIRILTLAAKHNVLPQGEWCVSLLHAFYTKEMQDALDALANNSTKELRRQTLALMETLHKRSMPRLAITTLGNFSVRRGSYVMHPEDWQRSQSMMLLKLIAARGGKNIPKEVLMEDLWEEETEEMQATSFKVLIHRLRKSLEPDMDSRWGSSYVILHDGKISLNEDTCDLDSALFIKHLDTAQQMEREQRPEEALKSYTQAMNLYAGEFMADELYSQAINQTKEYMRLRAMQALKAMALLYGQMGSYDNAIDQLEQAIIIAPFDEDIYYHLMKLLASAGRSSSACLVYRRCERNLRKYLGAEPGPQIEQLYRQISSLPNVNMS